MLEVMHTAFSADALETSHALNPPEDKVQTLQEITDIFDVITYCKVRHLPMVIIMMSLSYNDIIQSMAKNVFCLYSLNVFRLFIYLRRQNSSCIYCIIIIIIVIVVAGIVAIV